MFIVVGTLIALLSFQLLHVFLSFLLEAIYLWLLHELSFLGACVCCRKWSAAKKLHMGDFWLGMKVVGACSYLNVCPSQSVRWVRRFCFCPQAYFQLKDSSVIVSHSNGFGVWYIELSMRIGTLCYCIISKIMAGTWLRASCSRTSVLTMSVTLLVWRNLIVICQLSNWQAVSTFKSKELTSLTFVPFAFLPSTSIWL